MLALANLRSALFAVVCLVLLSHASAADLDLAARATNEFGSDLHRKIASPEENLCISPYSIALALGMTFVGADGDTREEMTRVLHFPPEGEAIHSSFDALQRSIADTARKTIASAEQGRTQGGPNEPIRLTTANRLFAQKGYDFRDVFKQIVEKFYGAPVELLDFHASPEPARQRINKWVSDQTRERIVDLIPPNGITPQTRLVLANAIYMKAPWQSGFNAGLTRPVPFHVRGGATVDVPLMNTRTKMGYAKRDGYSAATLRYIGAELQFVLLVPDELNGLAAIESTLNAAVLADCAKMPDRDVDLAVPKFKLQPPTIALSDKLKELGMRSAFDVPPASANFDRMAARQPNEYLALSEVFHKTFIAVDEHGTEAAAATAVAMLARSAAIKQPEAVKLVVDRPFIFAIQHIPTGACLFLGHVVDPR